MTLLCYNSGMPTLSGFKFLSLITSPSISSFSYGQSFFLAIEQATIHAYDLSMQMLVYYWMMAKLAKLSEIKVKLILDESLGENFLNIDFKTSTFDSQRSF